MDQILLLEECSKTQIPEHFGKFVASIIHERSMILSENKKILELFSLENDLIVCVLVTVALECGFRLEPSSTNNFDITVLRETKSSPKWRDVLKHIYRIDLFLAALNNYKFILLIVPIFGQTVLINFLTLLKDGVISSTGQALVPSQWVDIFSPTIPEKFINLEFLARSTKRFFQRERDEALNKENICNASLVGLPEELKRCVFELLGVRDYVNLTSACRALACFAKDPAIWKYFLKKHYGIEAEDAYETYVFRHSSNRDDLSDPCEIQLKNGYYIQSGIDKYC